MATVLAVAILALMPNRLWLPIGEAIGFVFALLVFRWIWLSYRDYKAAPAAAALRRQQILSGQFPTGTAAGQPSVSTCLAMDWNIEDAVATLVVFNDGTVSLYFYPRSGIAGAARFENVRRDTVSRGAGTAPFPPDSGVKLSASRSQSSNLLSRRGSRDSLLRRVKGRRGTRARASFLHRRRACSTTDPRGMSHHAWGATAA